MNDELLSVVDEMDQVIGARSRWYGADEISASINAGGNELTESFITIWRTLQANHTD